MRRPATLAIAALLALLVPTLPAGAVGAEGALAWGYKESFRSYVGRQTGAVPPIGAIAEGERIQVSAGAEFDLDAEPAFPQSTSEPNETLPYLFPVAGGWFEDEAAFTVRTRGAVTYRFPSHHFELTLSDLRLVVAGDSARLVGDAVQVVDDDFGSYTKGRHEVLDATLAEIAEADVALEGRTLTVRARGLTVHEDATEALPQSAGEVLDDLVLTTSLDALTDPVPGEETEEPGGGATGELSWRVGGTVLSLGTATLTEDGYLATAALPEVLVEDTRPGGAPWRVTGRASDLTGANGTVGARHLGWAPVLLSAGGGAVAGPEVAPRLAGGAGLGEPRVLGSAPEGHAPGRATLGGTLELLAPRGTEPGSYRAVVTLTMVG